MSDPFPTDPYVPAMERALDLAREAGEAGDVPVGAVLLDGSGEVVAADRNRREELMYQIAHADMLVMSARARAVDDWRLLDHTLVVTLEPCVMCSGAAVWARLARIVYGAADPKAGGAWSLYNIPQDKRLNHRIEMVEGLLAEQSAALLSGFFARNR